MYPLSSDPRTIGRRRFLQIGAGAAGALLASCGSTGPNDSHADAAGMDDAAGADRAAVGCATRATGPGQSYCLVEGFEVRLPGAARLAVGEVVLVNVDDNTAAIVKLDSDVTYPEKPATVAAQIR